MVSKYDVHLESIKFVADLGCIVFRSKSKDSQFKQVSLRFYPTEFGGVEGVGHEMQWLKSIARDTDLLTPEPLVAKDGSLVQPMPETLHNANCFVLLSWVPGRFFYKGLTTTHLRRVGEFTGQLHNYSERYTQRVELPQNRLAYLPELNDWREGIFQRPEWFSDDERVVLAAAAKRLLAESKGQEKKSRDYGLIHGDLHVENFLFHRGRVGAIDLSDCGWGHYVYDMAAILVYLKYPLAGYPPGFSGYDALYAAFVHGYQSVRALSPYWDCYLERCILMRLFVMLDWMTWCWPKPDYIDWGSKARSVAISAMRKYLDS